MAAATPTRLADTPMTLTLITAARPTLRHAHDAVAFALHCGLLERGCKLVSLTDAKMEGKRDEWKDLGAAAVGWNADSDGYCFQYVHAKIPDATVIVKAMKMEHVLVVHAIKGLDNIVSAEINVDDHVRTGTRFDDYSAIYNDAAQLVALLDRTIRSKLIPAEPFVSAAGATAPLDEDWQRGGLPMRPDFSGDLDPFGGRGGNLFGPDSFGPHGLRIPGRGGGAPRPRFDPFGPAPGIGSDPDFDELPPPGSRGPPVGPNGEPLI